MLCEAVSAAIVTCDTFLNGTLRFIRAQRNIWRELPQLDVAFNAFCSLTRFAVSQS